MKNVCVKDRKKHCRDHDEVRSFLIRRIREQRDDAFFMTLEAADADRIPEAEMYDFWLIRNMGSSPLDSDSIIGYLKKLYPNVEVTAYEGNLMAFPIASDSIEEVVEKIEDLLRFMQENRIDGFLVHSTNTIWMEQMHLVYREIVMAFPDMRAIFPRAKYYSYQHVCFARSIRSIFSNDELFGVDRYLLDNLEHRYPRGEPVKVLGVYYLDEGMDLARTADRLYLHRNTAKYRLNKISMLLGIDVMDVTKSQFLIMALAIKRLEKSSEKKAVRLP